MKILYLTQHLPIPENHGGKKRTLANLKILSKKHTITLVCFIARKPEAQYASSLKSLCKHVYTIHCPYTHIRYKKVLPYIFRQTLSLKPIQVRLYFNQEMNKVIQQLTKNTCFDAIHIEYASMVQYLPKDFQGLKIYDEHNIDWLGRLRLSKVEPNIIKKIFFLQDFIKLWFYEKKHIPQFDHWFAISNKDKQELIKLGAISKKTFTLPTPFSQKKYWRFNKKYRIIFVGLMTWDPNKKAIHWFYNNIFPIIRSNIPSAKLQVIGAFPHNTLIKAAQRDPRLELTGYIENLQPYFKQASVFIAPINTGSGLRIKILTAMAAGVPVVSTSLGVEGLNLNNYQEVLIADNPKIFAQHVTNVLNNQNLATKLSQNSLEYIKKHHNISATKQSLKRIYDQV